MRFYRYSTAFTLVELAIVLVIIGLLTGGVLAGQSLIRAAELRSVSADMQRYRSAFYAFRDKYQAIPGDMSNAVRFWGAAAGGTADGMDATCLSSTAIPTGTATCNGDGNGYIDCNGAPVGALARCTQFNERMQVWRHLANAGLIEGNYNGLAYYQGAVLATGLRGEPGKSIPKSRLSNGSFYFYSMQSPVVNSPPYWPGTSGNIMSFGQFDSNTNAVGNPLLNPTDAWNIDAKFDDGKPGTGKVMSYTQYNTSFDDCITNNVQATAEYNLTSTTTECLIYFQNI